MPQQKLVSILISFIVLSASLLIGRSVLAAPQIAIDANQPTSFIYQGMLSNASGPFNGVCDLRFRLFDALGSGNAVGAIVDKTNSSFTNGLFVVELDFGNVFNGQARWVETSVRCPPGTGVYTTLQPRQVIAAVPYAMSALTALDVDSVQGNFQATGIIRSTSAPNGDVAGALEVANSATGNYWTLHARATRNDALEIDFWDNTTKSWKFGSRFDRDGSFTAGGAVRAEQLEVIHTPVGPDDNGGAVIIKNGGSRNYWGIPIRATNNDSLEFQFWDDIRGSWHTALTFDRAGMLQVSHQYANRATLLQLKHPDAQINFHIDQGKHFELGTFDVATNTPHWNVIDIDRATSNVALGNDANSEFRLSVYGKALISTTYTNNSDLLVLQHSKTEWIFHVDDAGHPELGIKDRATGQTVWGVMDINQTTGHIGLGNTASTNERLKVYGNFTATGTKAATVTTQHFGMRKLYAVESASVKFSDEGLGTLINGAARIELDPVFVETIEAPYIIHLTPYGDTSLYVAEIGENYFIARVHEGQNNVQFAWTLSAARRGYANVRLESVTE